MSHWAWRWRILPFAAVAFFVQGMGCSGGREQLIRQNHLKRLALFYHEYCWGDDEERSPAGVQDITPQGPLDECTQEAIQGVKDGRYVVIWKVPIQKRHREGTLKNCVLGYEK